MKSFRLLPMKHSFRLTTKRSLERLAAREARVAVSPDKVIEVDGVSVDADKRAFLKLAGIAGLGVVASQMLPGKASAYVMGSTPTSNVVGVKDSTNAPIDPAKEGGNLATIATNTTKIGTLTFDGSNNLMVNAATGFSSQLENASGTIISPAKEDGNLATVATNTTKITSLSFDVSGNLKTVSASGGASGTVNVQDTTNTMINPSTDDSLLYLRRIVKLLESQATVDVANRQRVTVDSWGMPQGTGAAGTTSPRVAVATDSALNVAQFGGNNVSTGTGTGGVGIPRVTVSSDTALANVVLLAGQNHQMFQDHARNAFALGIRQNLTFS